MKPLRIWERWSLIFILLLAWGLRWIALMDVPPGWRDDDLIELYTFSKEILNSGAKLYFTGASGHEPLYHTIRAPLIAVAGLNQASARWQSAVFGTLAVLLTWAVGRRLFTREVGLLSGALVAVSFWALMYSRVAIRHIGALPWMLVAIYWGWRLLQDEHAHRFASAGIAIGTAGALLTYYAGRLIPALLGVALIFVGSKPGRWKPYLTALVVGIGLASPMFWAASRAPGGDARVSELALPLHELRKGNIQPLIQTTWTTLGMFHAKGDPEWLYNYGERPVFNIIGVLLFYFGILTRLAHLDQPNARMMLLWVGTGIAPAFISLPPSSLGHTILALPAVYILLCMPMKAAARRWTWTALPLMALTLSGVVVYDLPDYYSTWPEHSMVRFLYRGNYRDLAEYLDAHPEITNAVASSFLYGPWDKVAVETDLQRKDLRLRWVNPIRALISTGKTTHFYLQNANPPHASIDAILRDTSLFETPPDMQGFLLMFPNPPDDARHVDVDDTPLTTYAFNHALTLQAVYWDEVPSPSNESWIAFWWQVVTPLPLPPEVLIPNPPPPDVYNGPRLKIFTHLTSEDGTFITGDDGLWVDPHSLQVGDQFLQWHHFVMPTDAPQGPYTLNVGLYDPLTGERWRLNKGEDQITIWVE